MLPHWLLEYRKLDLNHPTPLKKAKPVSKHHGKKGRTACQSVDIQYLSLQRKTMNPGRSSLEAEHISGRNHGLFLAKNEWPIWAANNQFQKTPPSLAIHANLQRMNSRLSSSSLFIHFIPSDQKKKAEASIYLSIYLACLPIKYLTSITVCQHRMPIPSIQPSIHLNAIITQPASQ